MAFVQPTYASDNEDYWASDWNRDIVDNMTALHLYALSDIGQRQLFSASVEYAGLYTLGSQDTDFSVNFALGNKQSATIGSAPLKITVLTSDLACGAYSLKLKYGSDGAPAISFNSDVYWAGGALPSFSTDGTGYDVIGFINDSDGLSGVGSVGFARV